MAKEATSVNAPVTVYVSPRKRPPPPIHVRVERTTDFSPRNTVTGKSKQIC